MLRFLILLFPVAAVAGASASQDNPFGDPGAIDGGGLFGAEVTEAESDQGADQVPDLMARQWLETAGRGNRQLADAITALARTSRWSTLNLLLERLAQRSLDRSTLAQIQSRIPPDLFAKIQLSGQLSEAGSIALQELSAAAREQDELPQRLRRAIGGLDSESIDRRLASARILIDGGNRAIAELATAAVAADPPADRAVIVSTLAGLGPGGREALRQLALYAADELRARALDALGRIDAAAYRSDLLSAAHAMGASPRERAVARRTLTRLGIAQLSRTSAANALLAELRRLRESAGQLAKDNQTATHWSVDDSGQSVTYTKTKQIYSVYAGVADAAVRLRRVAGPGSILLIESLPAELSYRVIIDPDWGDAEQIVALRASYGGEWETRNVAAALDLSLDQADWPATVGLVRIMASVAGQSAADPWVFGSQPGPTPLVRAAAASDPRARFEAALLAARLADGRPYAGSSDVRKTLAEITRLEERPTAIIVETRADVIARLLGILAQLGIHGDVASGVSELQRRIELGGDLRMVLLKSDLSPLPAIEMIDLIRRTSRGSRLPIVFYGSRIGAEADAAVPSDRWDAPVEWIKIPQTPAALYGVLDEQSQRLRLPPLSVVDRMRYARQARDLLVGSSDRQ